MSSPELVSKTFNERDISPTADQQQDKRISRLNSCLTDKDPSLLPQSSVTYSEKDNEAILQQSEFFAQQQ